MQLGLVSAILPELPLGELFRLAAGEGFACVEVMCWPPGKAERRYAGVTHIDVNALGDADIDAVQTLTRDTGVTISALGYYPNPLDADPGHRKIVCDHLVKVIQAAPMLGVQTVTTFIGRDHTKSVADNLKLVAEVWPPIVAAADAAGVKIAVEHCPMIFGPDEWPGGKNVAMCPSVWRELFKLFPDTLGLNFDPSHLIWQGIDCTRALRDFGKHVYHAHAKDERIDRDKLYEVGVTGQGWHQPKLPGLGEVDWAAYFAALTDTGYDGPVCVEVEDRAYERNLADRKRAVRQSRRFLEQFFG